MSTLKERERAEEALKKNLKDARMELDRLMSSNQGMLIGMRRLEDDKTELAVRRRRRAVDFCCVSEKHGSTLQS